MKAVIIEDEPAMAGLLQKMIGEIDPDIHIVTVLQSIEESVDWFVNHAMPDVVFMDIHLADGPSFSIFDEAEVNCPVIFTTAYDQYALKAFQVNSIDYLLKPIDKSDLERALGKLRKIRPLPVFDREVLRQIVPDYFFSEKEPHAFKTRFLIPEKDKLIPLNVDDIAYIYLDLKMVKIVTLEEKTYYGNHSLDDYMHQLDPKGFFRPNRQYIIAKKAIRDITLWFGNKLIINLFIPAPERLTVSRSRVKDFKKWFTES